MKFKIITSVVATCFFSNLLIAQNIFPPSGFTGIGLVTPEVELHIVGETIDEYEEVKEKSGWTTRKGELIVSNVEAGTSKNDGFKITQIGFNTVLRNQEEKANLSIVSSEAKIFMNGGDGRISVSTTAGASNFKGAFNVVPINDNGVFVRCIKENNIGVTIKMKDDKDIALKVLDNNNKVNFIVQNNGEVYARRYTTTLNNIPDYVFDEDYNLMSLEELELFLLNENHLPNIPSAKEYSSSGVDLGEMNRLLLEKVEELTLYIIAINKELEVLKKQSDEK